MTQNNLERIPDKLKKIVSHFFNVEYYYEDDFDSFTPIIIIRTQNIISQDKLDKLQEKLKNIGFQVKVKIIKKKDLKKYYNLQPDNSIKRYLLVFEKKEFIENNKKLKNQTITQLILLIITSSLIIFSGFYYIIYIEPYYGSKYQQDPLDSFFLIFAFCIGMFSIITIHEFGHIFFAKKHKLKTSYPYLIPGPPPFGMLGAFVKIKDAPNTRNQKFDIAVGGIIFGIVISFILLIIGLKISTFIDTNKYIKIRAEYLNTTPAKEAADIHSNLNLYNFLYLFLRFLMFEPPHYNTYYGFNLPDKILILHPLAFAGWIGLLLSGLNLIPLPILDGGHILKALFPNKYTRLVGFIIGAVIFSILTRFFTFILILSCFSATKDLDEDSTEIANPTIPITRSRKIFSLFLIIIIILLFPLSYDNLLYGIGF
ncbi:MAG: site-2 protease family protein [Promethearchaeota archaeon]